MIKKTILLITFICATLLSTVALAQPDENPVSWKSSAKESQGGTYNITFTATIPSPWYIYDTKPYKDGPMSTTITIAKTAGIELIGTLKELNKPTVAYDEIFGMNIGHFSGTAALMQQVKVTTDKDIVLKALVEWQSCKEGMCLSGEKEMNIRLKGNPNATAMASDSTATIASDSTTDAAPQVATTAAGVKTGIEAEAEGATSLWSTIILAFIGGLAALLTPCVFPMLPMTVSFFLKRSGSKAKGRFMASMYGLFIVALYTVPIAAIIFITKIFGGDTVTVDIFNWLATHWLPNMVFFIVFMIFAASFLGAFEIVLPSKLVNKSDSNSDKGGLAGVFFMALTLVLVSFSCTGPIVGSILIESTKGAVWQPIITMLAFSVAFSLPFTIFAFFPSLLKNLPKSGGWLNSVKVVLGFIELALGLKFLSIADQAYQWGILDREVFLAIWIVIFSLLGLYLLGKLRFSHDSEGPYIKVKRLFLAIATFSFVVYLIPGMFGAPLKALSGYLPPMESQDFNMSKTTVIISNGSTPENSAKLLTVDGKTPKYSDKLHFPHELQGFFDYKEGLAYAEKVGKPVFIDFTGNSCSNCREMEARVWSDPAVLKLLSEDYVLIALYTDARHIELPKSDWITTPDGKVLKTLAKVSSYIQVSKYGVNGQPYYIVADDKGNALLPPKGYDLNIDNFVNFLTTGLEKYKQKQ